MPSPVREREAEGERRASVVRREVLCHSYGGNVCLDLVLKLASDWFGVGSEDLFLSIFPVLLRSP